MDYDVIIFWSLIFACLSGLAILLPRHRSIGLGSVAVYVVILVIDVLGSVFRQALFIHVAVVLWLVLALLPGIIARLYQRRFLQQQYAAASRLARAISWLHPMDGWREQPRIVHALELAQQSDIAAAAQILDRYRHIKSMAGITAMVHFYRLTGDWEGFLKWHDEQRAIFRGRPQLLPFLLRAKGETGDVRGMAELYASEKEQIRKLIHPLSRDMVRLPLFAFSGRRTELERLFAGSLSTSPASVRDFWIATADLASGRTESAKEQFERLLPAADASLRLAIQRRLAHLSAPAQPLDASVEQILEELGREQGHDERFGARRTLFSRQALATQILILLNVLMFAAELAAGGAENLDTLYVLGALFPPSVRAGEWWRLYTALFLHFGWLHLTMNMLALWVLGPFMEFALGLGRYLLVYLAAGIGSLAVLMWLGSASADGQLTVGASGCIMGLVGATGAIMLRGWRREKALSAKKRLGAMILVVAMQTLFDFMVPQVSMTAHLSGALIGFALTLLLPDRLAQSR
jgi:rhomboid protease GluP